jgi:hypothetical protein
MEIEILNTIKADKSIYTDNSFSAIKVNSLVVKDKLIAPSGEFVNKHTKVVIDSDTTMQISVDKHLIIIVYDQPAVVNASYLFEEGFYEYSIIIENKTDNTVEYNNIQIASDSYIVESGISRIQKQIVPDSKYLDLGIHDFTTKVYYNSGILDPNYSNHIIKTDIQKFLTFTLTTDKYGYIIIDGAGIVEINNIPYYVKGCIFGRYSRDIINFETEELYSSLNMFTPTLTNTVSMTTTASTTYTASASITQTTTPSNTISSTQSITPSPQSTPTISETITSSATHTTSLTQTHTISSTESITPSSQLTPTISQTMTSSHTITTSQTNSPLYTSLPIVTYNVTVQNAIYYINEIMQPELTLYLNVNYVFDTSDSSNGSHVFKVREVGNSEDYSGFDGTNLVISSYVNLEYYCTIHSGMGNVINVASGALP